MGKLRGFMEYDRIKEPVVTPKKRIKIIKNSQLLQTMMN